jgi:hypothetical protein
MKELENNIKSHSHITAETAGESSLTHQAFDSFLSDVFDKKKKKIEKTRKIIDFQKSSSFMTSTIRLNIKNPSRPNETPSIEARLAGTVLDVKRQLTNSIYRYELVDEATHNLFTFDFFFFRFFPLTSCSFQQDYPGNPCAKRHQESSLPVNCLRDDSTLADALLQRTPAKTTQAPAD